MSANLKHRRAFAGLLPSVNRSQYRVNCFKDECARTWKYLKEVARVKTDLYSFANTAAELLANKEDLERFNMIAMQMLHAMVVATRSLRQACADFLLDFHKVEITLEDVGIAHVFGQEPGTLFYFLRPYRPKKRKEARSFDMLLLRHTGLLWAELCTENLRVLRYEAYELHMCDKAFGYEAPEGLSEAERRDAAHEVLPLASNFAVSVLQVPLAKLVPPGVVDIQHVVNWCCTYCLTVRKTNTKDELLPLLFAQSPASQFSTRLWKNGVSWRADRQVFTFTQSFKF